MRPKSTRVKKTPEELAERKRQREAERKVELRYTEEQLDRDRPTLRRLLEGRYQEIEDLFQTINYRLQCIESRQVVPQLEILNRNFQDVNSNVNLMIGMLQKMKVKLDENQKT